MYQILAMIFFSAGAVVAIGAMVSTFAKHWERVSQAVGAAAPRTPLPRALPARVRSARTSPRVVLRPALRAAA